MNRYASVCVVIYYTYTHLLESHKKDMIMDVDQACM